MVTELVSCPDEITANLQPLKQTWGRFAPYAAFPLPEGIIPDVSLPVLTRMNEAQAAFACLVCGHNEGLEVVRSIAEMQKGTTTLFGIRGFYDQAFLQATPLDQIGMVVTADDRGRGALEFMRSFGWQTPVEYARTHLVRNPELFLSYLIRQAAIFSVAGVFPVAHEFFVGNLERVAMTITDANIGQQNDRNDDIYSRINDAVSLVKDMLIAEKTPNAFALAHAVLSKKLDTFYGAARYNTEESSRVILSLLGDVFGDACSSVSDLTIRGNIKPANALLLEALRDKKIQEAMLEMAPNLGFSDQYTSPKLLDAIIEAASRANTDTETTQKVMSLILLMYERMDSMYDMVRARVYCKNPHIFDGIVNAFDDWVRRMPDDRRKVYGDRVDSYLRASLYTREATKRERINSSEYGRTPSGEIIRRFLQLPDDSLLYGANHIHMVASIDRDIGELRFTSDAYPVAVVGVELQVALQATRSVLDVLDRAYKSSRGTLQSAGFQPELIRALAQRTKKALRNV